MTPRSAWLGLACWLCLGLGNALILLGTADAPVIVGAGLGLAATLGGIALNAVNLRHHRRVARYRYPRKEH